MSGGIAYVIDEDGDFEQRVNHEMVEVERLAVPESPLDGPENPTRRELLADPLSHDAWRLRTLIARQALFTDSSRAQEILQNFDEYLPRFYKVVPIEFRRALEEQPVAVGSV